MKNKLSCLLVLTSLLGLGLINNQQNHEDLIDYNYDALSTNVKRYALSEMRTLSEVETSKIYVQTATKDNEHYLRFATAIKGDVTSIKFTRELIGIEETETVKAISTKEIDTLYKGISSGEETSYFSGSQELIDQQITSTKDYYWACYTIKFSENSSYLSTPIRMTLSINDEEIKTRTTSFNDELNNIYNGDLVDYLDLAGDNYNITLKKVSDNIKSDAYKIPQGGCTDGKYLYYALNEMGSRNTKLVKYDISTKATTFSEVIKMGTDEINVKTPGKTFIYHNMIGLILQDGSIKFFDKETLTENTTQTLKFTGALKTADIYDISYNEKLDKFVLINRNGNMYFAANDLVTYDSGTRIAITDFLNDISTDENYIYAVGGKDGLIGGEISIYDWYGNKIKEKINFNDTDNKTGITLNQGVNVQSVIKFDDKYYCAVNRYNDDGLFICELVFNNNVNKTTLDLNFNDSIDYIEKTNKNINEFKCQQLLKYTGRQARGACTDGNYMYLSLTTSGALNTKLVNYNLKTNRIEKESEEFEINTTIEYSQTKGSAFICNDNIYVCTLNNQFKIFDKNLNALNNGENVSLLKDFTDTIVDVESNDTLKRFAILGKKRIYFYNTEGNLIISKYIDGSFYSSNFMNADKWFTLQDITSTDKYIYALSNADGLLGGGISIFDWNGNSCDKLKEKYNEKGLKSFVLKNTTSKCATSDGKYNGQSIIVNGDNLYFIALNYGSESGTFVFNTKFSFNK